MQQNPMIYQLYAVTAPAADLAEQVKRAIAGGITMLQIREKNCTTKRRIELAYPILQLCRDAGIPCIIDDDAEAAKILGADGVHVGQRDMKIQQAREILGDQAIIGTSAHNVAEALQAEQDGATYLGCGAVFSTQTKHDATFLPHDVLCDIRQAVSIPVVAIGGINAQNIPKLYDTGIDGVAVVSRSVRTAERGSCRTGNAGTDCTVSAEGAGKMTIAPVLTIAGSDSSGGAGVQADLKTMTMLGCFGMSAITALTAQNTLGVQGICPVPAEFLKQQIAAVCEDIPPAAVKVGMVYDTPQILAIAEAVAQYQLPHVVVDPVMVATSGDPLLKQQAQQALTEQLFPLAELLTPNLPEAEQLTGTSITSPPQMEQAARQLSETYHTAVLLKGGHSVGSCNDLLYAAGTATWFSGQRTDTPNTHGTGCTLSSAIASFLAQGASLEESVRRGKAYISDAIAAGLSLGHGHGPIAHNYAILRKH